LPEGDTLHAAARTLARALEGARLTEVHSQVVGIERAELVGHVVETVRAVGKHLLIVFDDGRALRTHMKMTGSWHLYRPGEGWQDPKRDARVVLGTAAWVAVCFRAPVVQLLSANELRTHPVLLSLGPDLLAPEFDVDVAAERVRRHAGSIALALLDQTVVSGIGNIHRCEVLFRRRIEPHTPAKELSTASIAAILLDARRALRRALHDSAHFVGVLTRPRVAVHRRAGLPCGRCGASIRAEQHGSPPRWLFWCPGCQTSATARDEQRRA
jgi:endonuclease VIII